MARQKTSCQQAFLINLFENYESKTPDALFYILSSTKREGCFCQANQSGLQGGEPRWSQGTV